MTKIFAELKTKTPQQPQATFINNMSRAYLIETLCLGKRGKGGGGKFCFLPAVSLRQSQINISTNMITLAAPYIST
jgi:hypothetical protein